MLELGAVSHALRHFLHIVRGRFIRVMSDNSTVVAYINFQDGSRSPFLCREACLLWAWCIAIGFFPSSSSHPRDRQCDGGSAIETGTLNKLMETQSCRLSPDRPSLGNTEHRSVRLGCGSPTPDLLFSDGEPSSIRVGCPLHLVEERVGLRLSSSGTHPAGTVQDQDRPGESADDRPLLAFEGLVHQSSGSPDRRPPAPPGSPGPSSSSRGDFSPPRLEGTSSGVLATRRRRAKEAGLSERAANIAAKALRSSTRRCYDARINLFRQWCRDNQADPGSPSLANVADFFLFSFNKGYQVRATMSYRSALAAVLPKFEDGSSMSTSEHLSNIIRSLFLKRPPFRPLLPA